MVNSIKSIKVRKEDLAIEDCHYAYICAPIIDCEWERKILLSEWRRNFNDRTRNEFLNGHFSCQNTVMTFPLNFTDKLCVKVCTFIATYELGNGNIVSKESCKSLTCKLSNARKTWYFIRERVSKAANSGEEGLMKS